MPGKYVISVRPVRNRFEPVARSGVIAWEEGCLKCAVCVKKRCVYAVYEKRGLKERQMIESLDNQCMNCLRCVQSCPKGLIHKSINPEYLALGNGYWVPEIVTNLWRQAETGKIPVSGAGYPGPFSGPGFDSMWTDMSEIVRPTRDGIHGREYISTAVDLGKVPPLLRFDAEGGLVGERPSVIDVPLPILMKVPPFGSFNEETVLGWATAARRLNTLLALPLEMVGQNLKAFGRWLMPSVSLETGLAEELPEGVRLIETPWIEDWREKVSAFQRNRPEVQVAVKIPVGEGMEEKAFSLAEGGVHILHLGGNEESDSVGEKGLSLKEAIRSVHLGLVERNIRGEATLLASGGLAMAEHVAKSLICGADAVFVGLPILIALECRVCGRCVKGLPCPVEIERAPSKWTTLRVLNLLGAWHNQLLEVMGAMGIRDARRLRGEAGRAMFFEELDRSAFGSLGEAGNGCELE